MYPSSPWKSLQYSNYTQNNPVISHVSCSYSCCCSVGRLVVTPPISRRSRSGLSSHVSFRSLVLTWCVGRREGEDGGRERREGDSKNTWHMKNDCSYQKWGGQCTKEIVHKRDTTSEMRLPLQMGYLTASLEWDGNPHLCQLSQNSWWGWYWPKGVLHSGCLALCNI